MAEEMQLIFECTKCNKVLKSEKGLKEHQNRKRKGKKTGCFVKSVDSASGQSSSDSLLGSSSVDSYGMQYEFSDASTDALLDELSDGIGPQQDFLKGKESLNCHSESSLTQLTMKCKIKNSSVLDGETMSISGHQGGSRVELPSIQFVHGLVTAAVEKIVNHPDFPKDHGESIKETIDRREARSKIFQGVFVDHHQENAVRKHLCVARECSDTCTFAKRKTLFHQQQTMLALEVARVGKVLRRQWVQLAAQHLKRLKVDNMEMFNVFLPYVHNIFSDTEITTYLCDLPHSSLSDVPDPPTSHPRAIQVVPAGNGLEVSTKRVERAEARTKRRRVGNI